MEAILKGKNILITGGGSGIGEALALNLAKQNRVIICGRDAAKLIKVAAASTNISYYVADISQPEAIDNLFERIAADQVQLHVLFNNAGVSEVYDVKTSKITTPEIFKKIDTNLSAAIGMIQQFIHQADQAGADNIIVNVTSQIAIFPFPILGLYSASKTGLSIYTKILRQQLKASNFRVVEILPSQVATEMPRRLKNQDDAVRPDIFAAEAIKAINNGKLEYAPGAGVLLLKMFNKFLPKLGLKVTDKLSRKLFKE